MKKYTNPLKLLANFGSISQHDGQATSVLAFALSVLCFLAVLGFYFPEYLTAPDVRVQYKVEHIRLLLLAALIFCAVSASLNLLLKRYLKLNFLTLSIIGICFLLGGHQIPVSDFEDKKTYLGLDFFILDLLFSALFFSFLEKLRPIKPQILFRKYWQTDLLYFAFNHLAIGLVLFIMNYFINRYFINHKIIYFESWLSTQATLIQLFFAVLIADLVQYAIHFAYHKVPFLWRIHAIHHSIEELDWLAGSRLHVLEVLLTRTFVLGVLIIFGIQKSIIDLYIVIVGFQAVLNHSNIRIPEIFNRAPLKYIFVTPNFHHWHHSQDRAAIDKNFASHFAFIDYIFGTQVRSYQNWPQQYGVKDELIPDGFLKQHLYVFLSQKKTHLSKL